MSYDRRAEAKDSVGQIGVSYDQLSQAVRREVLGDPNARASVNILFGPVTPSVVDRAMIIPFTARLSGKEVAGRVVFQIIEVNARQWAGTPIRLDCYVKVDSSVSV